jgi:hypothetical protein
MHSRLDISLGMCLSFASCSRIIFWMQGKAADADAAGRMGHAFKAFAEGVIGSHHLKLAT